MAEVIQCQGVETYKGVKRFIPGVDSVPVEVERDESGIIGVNCEFLSPGNICDRTLQERLPIDIDRDPLRPLCVIYDPIPLPEGSIPLMPVTGIPDKDSGSQEKSNTMIDGVLHLQEGISFRPFQEVSEIEQLDEEGYKALHEAYHDGENIDMHTCGIAIEEIVGGLALMAPFGEEIYYASEDFPMGSVFEGTSTEYTSDGFEIVHITDSPLVMVLFFDPKTYDEYRRLSGWLLAIVCGGKKYYLDPLGDQDEFDWIENEDEFIYRELVDSKPIPERNGSFRGFALLPWNGELLSQIQASLVSSDHPKEVSS